MMGDDAAEEPSSPCYDYEESVLPVCELAPNLKTHTDAAHHMLSEPHASSTQVRTPCVNMLELVPSSSADVISILSTPTPAHPIASTPATAGCTLINSSTIHAGLASASSIISISSSPSTDAHESTSASAAPLSPRNLAADFMPIEVAHTNIDAISTAGNAAASSSILSTPTPRVSWPIGYMKASSSSQSKSVSKSAKRKSTNNSSINMSQPISSATGSRFAECPICSKSIALIEMDEHLDNNCQSNPLKRAKLARKDDMTDVKSKPTPVIAKRTNSIGAINVISSSHQGSSFAECPMCAMSVPIATINHHLDLECKGTKKQTTKPQQPVTENSVAKELDESKDISSQGEHPHALPIAASAESAPSAAPAIFQSQLAQPTVSVPFNSATAPSRTSSTSQSPSMPATDTAVPTDTTASNSSNSPPAAAHAFFTAGPRAAAAFQPTRKGRNDGVKCALLSYFTVACASVSTSTSKFPFICEWQDESDSAKETPFIPSVCDARTMSNYSMSSKYHDPSVDEWTDVLLHAQSAALESTIMDLQSPALPSNIRTVRRFKLSPSMLKSLLQKNIRLSRPAAAVRIAIQLMQQVNLVEFLRRFSVIILEDAILHPNYAFLIWMTIACGKHNPVQPFQPTVQHINALLRMVYEVAAVSTKDTLLDAEFLQNEKDAQSSNAAPVNPPSLLDPLSSLSPSQRELIKSLLVRACLGGSPWDVSMLRSYAALWLKRFQTERQLQKPSLNSDSAASSAWITFLHSCYSQPTPAAAIDIQQAVYLQDDDLVLSAVDYHCSPILDQLLRKESCVRSLKQHGFLSPESSLQALRTVMWEFRSKLTNKQLLRPKPDLAPDPNLAQLWKSLKVEIDLTAKRILQQRIESPNSK